MPRRTRYIKPQRLEDPKFAEVSVAARYLYREMACFMDCRGLVPFEPRLYRNNIFGFDEAIKAIHVLKLVEELIDIGYYAILKQGDDDYYIFDIFFVEDQKPHHGESAQFPNPEELQHVEKSLGLAWAESRLNPLQTRTLTLTFNSNHNGDGVLGEGVEQSSICEPVQQKAKAESPKGAIGELLDFEEYLANVTMKLQRAWVERYGIQFTKTGIQDAIDWVLANPQRQKKNYGNFFNNWLRKNYQSQNDTKPSFYTKRGL